MTARLAAVDYYLAGRDHENELIKLINFACRCVDTTQSVIRQNPPSDKIGGNDDNTKASDENQSRADHQRP